MSDERERIVVQFIDELHVLLRGFASKPITDELIDKAQYVVAAQVDHYIVTCPEIFTKAMAARVVTTDENRLIVVGSLQLAALLKEIL